MNLSRIPNLALCLAALAALSACQTGPYQEQPYSTRSLERNLSKRFDIGTPAEEVVSELAEEGWSCRPIVSGEMIVDAELGEYDFKDAEAMICQRFRNVAGGERVSQVRIGLRDGLVSSGAASVDRYKAANPRWGYR